MDNKLAVAGGGASASPLEEAVPESIFGEWFLSSHEGKGAVNFMGASATDILLHFNPRPEEGCIVLNSCAGGVWGSETKLPLPDARPLSASVVVSEAGFRISIGCESGAEVALEHRLDPSSFSGLRVDGLDPWVTDLVASVVIAEWNFQSSDATGSANIMAGPDDILLHINPRPSEGEIVLNSLLLGCWGAEERLPLPAARPLRINVCARNEGFVLRVDGGKPYMFLHRGDPSDFTGTRIDGASPWTKERVGVGH